MDTLRDWYRYLDEVSRPARRGEGDTPESSAEWRPWRSAPEAEPARRQPAPARGVRLQALERPTAGEAGDAPPLLELPSLDLGGGTGHLAEALQAPTPEFQDPTLYDELSPMPEFTVRPLAAPSFELAIPRFGQPAAPEETAASTGIRTPEETGVKGGAAVVAEGPESAAGGATDDGAAPGAEARMDQYRELLRRFREEEDPGPARGRARESRDELLQRLLDPVLTLEETAVLLDVCPATVRRYTNKGQLKHFRTEGNQRRFRLWDVIEFRDSREGRPAEGDAEGQPAGDEDE
ncbi:MAG: helix-turn-helix domain-containing protein [Armatimonadota bacterium]